MAIKKHLVPLIALDAPELVDGPYTDGQFQAGHISTRDLGKLYGYIYRPERFTGDEAGVMGTSTSHPVRVTPGQPMRLREEFPWCPTREQAIKFLQDHKYYGRVLRYALDDRVLRGEYEDVVLLSEVLAVRRKCRPWCTAGVTDVVNAPTSTAYHGHLLGGVPQIYVRQPDFVPAQS